MADTDRIKRNLAKMIDQGAPEADLNAYLASEGFKSPDEWRAAIAPKAASQPASKPPGISDGTAQAFGQGATFGFGDELTATVRAAFPKFSDWMMRGPALERDPSIGGQPKPQTVSEAPTFAGRYDEELARERAKERAFAEANPATAATAKIAGGVAGAAATLPALPAALTATGPGLAGNVLRSAAVGGGMGALTGFGEGEGGDGRTINALLAGTVGGVAGAAMPVAGAGFKRLAETGAGRWVGRNVVAPVARMLTPGPVPPQSLSAAADGGRLPGIAENASNTGAWGAIDRLATAIQRSGRDPASLIAEARRLGPEAVLADLDPTLLAIANGTVVLPGQTRGLAENVLQPRDRGAAGRVVRAFEGTEPPPSTFALRGEGQAFDQHLRAIGQRVYGAMDDAGLRQSPELMEIYQNPHVSAAIDRVLSHEKATRIGTGRPPASPVEIMHKVKQAIWDLGFDKDTARPGPMASWYRDLGIEYMNRLKAANPALAEADRAYAGAASLPEYFDMGRNWMRGGSGEAGMNASAPALGDALGNATEQQVAAARAGSTNAVRETIQGRGSIRATRALTRDLTTSDEIRARLVQLYGPERAAEIIARGEVENVFANTSNKLLTGSRTAHNTADALNVGGDMPVPTGGSVTNMLQYLSQARDWLVRPNEEVRNAIGRMMLTQDADEIRRALDIAAEIIRRRRGGNALLGVAPEAAATSVAGN